MKAFLVVKREYLENVRKRSFLISTILAPVLMLILYAIPVVSMLLMPGEQQRLAVLDRTGAIAGEFAATIIDTLKDGRRRFVVDVANPRGGDFDAAREELIGRIGRGELDILLDIPEGVLEEGRIDYVARNLLNDDVTGALRGRLNPIIIKQRFAEEGFSSDRITALTRRVWFDEKKITRSGMLEHGQVAGDYGIAVFFVMLLYMMLLSWGISVQRSIITEKTSRVIEVMLSSVEPRDLFIGKIIGIGALGFTQVAIWAVLMAAIAFSSALAASTLLNFVQIEPVEIFFLILFFILGFLMYSAMFTIIGAVCSTEQDAQQLQSIVIFPLVIPIMLMFLVLQNPDSTVAVVLSLIPLFTPMLMLARISVGEPAAWQVFLSIGLLVVSIYGVIVFSARVFRVGILMYGKRPNLKEIWRWSRYS